MNTADLDIRQTKKLNEIAKVFRDKYASFVNVCCKEHRGDDYWWMTTFANRNSSWDSTYKRICQFILCLDEIEKGNHEDIVVDSLGIKKAIDNIFDSKVEVSCNKKKNKKKFLFQYLHEAKEVLIIRKYAKRIKKPKVKSMPLMVVTPVVSSMIDEDGFRDGYFNNIEKYIEKDFYCVPSLVKTDNKTWEDFICLAKGIDCRKQVFLESYGKWYDLLSFFSFVIKSHIFAKEKYVLEGYDITPIIRESLLNTTSILRTFCDYKAFGRLVKKIKVDRLVIWYEARPLDNMMAMVYNRTNPHGVSIGYTSFPPSEQNIGIRLLPEQIEQQACPKMISVTGPKFIDEIKEFDKSIDVIVVPSMRNSYYKIDKEEHSVFSILVAVSYNEIEAKAMLIALNEYMKSEDEIKVFIKMHPANSSRNVESYLGKSPSFDPVYVNDSILECAKKVDAVFVSRTSASMEIICGGVNLICFSPKGELIDTFIAKGVDQSLYSVVFDEFELASAIDKIKKGTLVEKNVSINDYFLAPKLENFKNLYL